ncbi:hypothetical protein AB0H83_51220 [Dactylosporangium sp. NPDC050688]|uniref:hypothetical protein n=1 Tax=Dactylosporangium sp. NPDC050688 TaxID=3157217 RepID=UPI00340B1D94
MNHISQREAWKLINACADVNAGRLTGRNLRHQYLSPVLPGTLTPDAALQLHASVYRSRTTPAGPDTIWYVVSSDGTPVAWLTLILREFANSEANSARNRRRKGYLGPA